MVVCTSSDLLLSCTCGTEAFEAGLLAADQEAFVATSRHRDGHSHEAVGIAAVGACEVGVALGFGAVVGKLEVLRSFLDKCFMHEADLREALECAVDCDFIEAVSAQSFCNLVLADGSVGF